MTDGAVSAQMRGQIRASLQEIAAQEGVSILLAVESGSRAWGFHSPDSDYDVRFIYAEPLDWHLTIAPGRDVIERPISKDLDISGWNLRKTLGLTLNSNAVALEWAQSPILYADAAGFRDEFLAFARAALRRRPVTWHYLRLAERQSERLRDADGMVKLKRYFYVLRPVLALRWLRLHADRADPPMHMAALVEATDLAQAAQADMADLIARKSTIKEMGVTSQTPASLDALITTEMAAAREAVGAAQPNPKQTNWLAADALLRDWTHKVSRAP